MLGKASLYSGILGSILDCKAADKMICVQAAAPARAFVCQNFTCRAPTSDPAALRQLLQQPPAAVEGPRKPAFTEVSSINLT